MPPVNFLWPWGLSLLSLVPLVALLYRLALRRRRKGVIRFSSLTLIRAAQPARTHWRRHVPLVFFLLAVTGVSLAVARPVAIISIPTNQTTILLTVDVSRSMCSNDILPSRLQAAQQAMLDFIQRQPPGTQLGIVAFSGLAELVQVPTTDREQLRTAVNSLMTGRRTAIGSALLKSIDAIAEIDPQVARSVSNPADAPNPVLPGAYVPEIIVLLTDGASNTGPLPQDAARQAHDRGIRVYTIGYGTAAGGALNCPTSALGNEPPLGRDPFSGFGGGGGGAFRRGIDEATLKRVADDTGGQYYSAESASELNQIFQDLPTHLITQHATQEISALAVGLGALCLLAAIALALLWSPLP